MKIRLYRHAQHRQLIMSRYLRRLSLTRTLKAMYPIAAAAACSATAHASAVLSTPRRAPASLPSSRALAHDTHSSGRQMMLTARSILQHNTCKKHKERVNQTGNAYNRTFLILSSYHDFSYDESPTHRHYKQLEQAAPFSGVCERSPSIDIR